MRNLTISILVLLGSFGLARADQFVAQVTKVDAGKLTMKKLAKEGEKADAVKEVILDAADAVKVSQASKDIEKPDPQPVEGGLKNKLFQKAAVTAYLTTTDNDKVSEVLILEVHPNNEFVATITKVDGQKITMSKFDLTVVKGFEPLPSEDLTLTAADKAAVNMGKFNPAYQKFDAFDTGEAVEGGLKNKLFHKASVLARVSLENEKVVSVLVMGIQPDNEIPALLKKIDGKTVTFVRSGLPTTKSKEEVTLKLGDNVQVLDWKFNDETKKFGTLPGGLNNDLFKRENLGVLLVTNDDNQIVEIRVFFQPPVPK